MKGVVHFISGKVEKNLESVECHQSSNSTRLPTAGTWRLPLTRRSPRQCEDTQAIVIHGPSIILRTMQSSIIPLHLAMVPPHLECAMKANSPSLRTDINHLEWVQRLATRLLRGLRHEEMLRLPNLSHKEVWATSGEAFSFSQIFRNVKEYFKRMLCEQNLLKLLVKCAVRISHGQVVII